MSGNRRNTMRNMQKSQHNAAIHGLQITLQSLRPARKYLNLVVVLVLGVLGYLVGPDNMPMGNYTAEIDVTLADLTLSAAHPFTLGSEAGQPVIDTQTNGAYQLVIEGKDTYQYGLDQSISYRLQALDATGLACRFSLRSTAAEKLTRQAS